MGFNFSAVDYFLHSFLDVWASIWAAKVEAAAIDVLTGWMSEKNTPYSIFNNALLEYFFYG